jgi:ketosteroid isomerase-like protein
MADDAEIRALGDRYAAAVDDRDIGGLLAIFAPDATLARRPGDDGEPGFELTGHDALRGIIRRLIRDYRSTSHVLGERHYDIEGATAAGEIHCTAHHLREAPGGDLIDRVLHLRYLDTYERTGDTWRITRRELHVDRTEELPVEQADA